MKFVNSMRLFDIVQRENFTEFDFRYSKRECYLFDNSLRKFLTTPCIWKIKKN